MQSSPASTPREQLRIRTVARAVLREQGPAGFFRGLLPCVLRSVPVNAVTFWGYEWSMHSLHGAFGDDIPMH